MKLLAIFVFFILLFGCCQFFPAGPSSNQTTSPPSGTAQPGGTAPDETEPQTQPSSQTQPQSGTGLESREISYKAGAWVIYGTLYESQSKVPSKVVVLLPALGKTRDSYPASFINGLHNNMPDAIIVALDMRGHGKSTNLGTYSSFDTAQFKDMKGDVIALKPYLDSTYPNLHSVYLVGASLGSTAAILAGAQDRYINKVVMISPGMEYPGVNITTAAQDYMTPLLLIASSGDSYSAQSLDSIVELKSSPQVETKLYPGSAHGTDLFDATNGAMADLVIQFLKK